MKRSLAVALLGIVGCICTYEPVLAWGKVGHHVIADLAYARLNAQARHAVDAIIARSPLGANTSCPIDSFEHAATWPDCVRERRYREYAYLSPLHYEDRPYCGIGSRLSYCHGGMCVTSAIQSAIRTLKSPTQSALHRAIALAEIVHFVGDLHQPLHLTDNQDRGGNELPVTFPNHSRTENLHSVWDADLVVSSVGYRGQRIGQVVEMVQAHRRDWSQGTIESWAEETHQLGIKYSYGLLPRKVACNNDGTQVETLGEDYVDRSVPVVQAQLAKASLRLAVVLNTALGSSDNAP